MDQVIKSILIEYSEHETINYKSLITRVKMVAEQFFERSLTDKEMDSILNKLIPMIF